MLTTILSLGKNRVQVRAQRIDSIREVHQAHATTFLAYHNLFGTLFIREITFPRTSPLFQNEWLVLLVSYGEFQPLSKLLNKDAEILRRLADMRGWIELHLRVMIWNLAYLLGKEVPRFPTDTGLVGIIIRENEDVMKDLGEDLAKLGVPVWMIREEGSSLDMVPEGETARTWMWIEAEKRASLELGENENTIVTWNDMWMEIRDWIYQDILEELKS